MYGISHNNCPKQMSCLLLVGTMVCFCQVTNNCERSKNSEKRKKEKEHDDLSMKEIVYNNRIMYKSMGLLPSSKDK